VPEPVRTVVGVVKPNGDACRKSVSQLVPAPDALTTPIPSIRPCVCVCLFPVVSSVVCLSRSVGGGCSIVWGVGGVIARAGRLSPSDILGLLGCSSRRRGRCVRRVGQGLALRCFRGWASGLPLVAAGHRRYAAGHVSHVHRRQAAKRHEDAGTTIHRESAHPTSSRRSATAAASAVCAPSSVAAWTRSCVRAASFTQDRSRVRGGEGRERPTGAAGPVTSRQPPAHFYSRLNPRGVYYPRSRTPTTASL
jgi:hypothetical protein